MSKPRPPRDQASAPPSSRSSVLTEKIKVQLEILRRQDYQDLLALRARLAKLPPVPEPIDAPANDD